MTESMSKTLNNYLTALGYVDKTLLVLLDASSGVSPFSFTTVISTLVRTASASLSLVFLVTNGIANIFFGNNGKEKINIAKLRYWPGVN